MRIEDYGLIGDTQTAALVGRDGSVDWLCLPRFDSEACFARLLGDERHGYFRIAPTVPVAATRRRYRGDSLVLETEFETREGVVRLVDCMPVRRGHPELVRLVEGVRGSVPLRMELVLRFGYGSVVPWVRTVDGLLAATAGPHAVRLWTPVATRGEAMRTVAELTVREGQHVPFLLAWHASHEPQPPPLDARFTVACTERWWQDWAERCAYEGPYREAVVRSLVTLKALTYAPTGGIVAAPTTSLPEAIGGTRNWDYRYCWLRDATFTLYSLVLAGYHDEAAAFRDWLLRAAAGSPSDLQILYGPAGERRIEEYVVDWLPGYEGSRPVRVGNAAAGQFQLDVYGEVLDLLHQCRVSGMEAKDPSWGLEQALVEFLCKGAWREPDDGIWEVRGPRRQFVHSKVMAWVALDRAVADVERFGLDGPVETWRRVREEIHAEVLQRGFDAERQTFTQYYGSRALDASLLMIPLVGFLPPSDPRVRGTVAAIERELVHDGLVRRYATDGGEVDGVGGGEGAFLPCSFWLADALCLLGREPDARSLFERLLGLRNDLGLLSEEYDPATGRLVGNFPQAFSHVALVNSAFNLAGHGAARARTGTSAPEPGSDGSAARSATRTEPAGGKPRRIRKAAQEQEVAR
jgi:GH15 family glucan-1,4-alpha-glucosidase